MSYDLYLVNIVNGCFVNIVNMKCSLQVIQLLSIKFHKGSCIFMPLDYAVAVSTNLPITSLEGSKSREPIHILKVSEDAGS